MEVGKRVNIPAQPSRIVFLNFQEPKNDPDNAIIHRNASNDNDKTVQEEHQEKHIEKEQEPLEEEDAQTYEHE